MEQSFPIDAVITWVDGNDPAHQAKLREYVGGTAMTRDDIAALTRFNDLGEIHYCVASIRKFAPFIRKIFIVTDGQDPKIEGVEIVDHSVIFSGYSQYLPTFSSLSIESVLWRIPGLAEHYIYFNDDVMLRRPCRVDDFFHDGKAICYAHNFSLPLVRMTSVVSRKVGFKHTLAKTAMLLGEKRVFPYISHMPHIIRRSVQEDYFTAHEDVLTANISHRLRAPEQINPQELAYICGMREGKCEMRSRKGKELYLKPKEKKGYVRRKLDAFDRNQEALSVCINSLDAAGAEDRKLIFDWLDRLVR